MEIIETPEVVTSYEPFSREPEYIEGNRQFIKELPFKSVNCMLDLACGTGTISELVLEENPDITIYGLDLSRESLELGQTDFKAAGFSSEDEIILRKQQEDQIAEILLIEGTADCLPMKDNWAEMVFQGHSIHMIPDLEKLLLEIHRVLTPGGIFAFNSSFYAGSQAEGTDHFYQLWWKFALQYITEKSQTLQAEGKPGIPRKRGTAKRAKPWMSKDDWFELLNKVNLQIEKVNERVIMMSQSSFETIGAYSGMAELMLSGYPVQEASEALIAGVRPALEEVGEKELPRLWLEFICKKP